MAFEEDSESQLLQVSKGAQKLTEMIETWSKVPGFDKRSNDVARDILQGALDLEESLVMLGKLQEASRKFDNIRKCQEMELKYLIRDRFSRQNSLSTVSSSNGITSSNRSFRFPSSTVPEETRKAKNSNLIAKLMGLEEVPLEAPNFVGIEGKKKNLIRSRSLVFDLEMPRSSMLLRRTTFDEIIQTMQSKGLLKTDNARSDSSDINGNPPIVIMKPLRAPSSAKQVYKNHCAYREIQSVRLIRKDKVSNRSRTEMQKFERKESNKIIKSKLDFASHLPQSKQILKIQKKSSLGTIPSETGYGHASSDLPTSEKNPTRWKNNLSKYTKERKNQKETSQNTSKSPSRRLEDNKAGAKSVNITTLTKSKDKSCKRVIQSIYTTLQVDSGKKERSPSPVDYQPCMIDENIRIPGSGRGSSELSEQTIRFHDHDEQMYTGDKNGMNVQLRRLLLSSKAFLNHSQVFLGTSYDQPTEISQLGMRNSKLFLDYANEFLMRKHCEMKQKSLVSGAKLYKSLDQLVEEICTEIQKQYGSVVDGSDCRLNKTSGRDLKFKDMEKNSTRDIGWKRWIIKGEVEQIVGFLADYNFSILVQEVVTDLVKMY